MTNKRVTNRPDHTGSPGTAASDGALTPTDDRTVLDSRTQRAFGQIVEDAAVTGELTDEAAQALLEWALGETRRLVAATQELEECAARTALAPKIRYLRRHLRQVARSCADEDNPTDALHTHLSTPDYPEP